MFELSRRMDLFTFSHVPSIKHKKLFLFMALCRSLLFVPVGSRTLLCTKRLHPLENYSNNKKCFSWLEVFAADDAAVFNMQPSYFTGGQDNIEWGMSQTGFFGNQHTQHTPSISKSLKLLCNVVLEFSNRCRMLYVLTHQKTCFASFLLTVTMSTSEMLCV